MSYKYKVKLKENSNIIQAIEKAEEALENLNKALEDILDDVEVERFTNNCCSCCENLKTNKLIGYVFIEDKENERFRPTEIYMFVHNDIEPQMLCGVAEMLKESAKEDNFRVCLELFTGDRFLLTDGEYCYGDQNYKTKQGYDNFVDPKKDK